MKKFTWFELIWTSKFQTRLIATVPQTVLQEGEIKQEEVKTVIVFSKAENL